MPIDFDDELPAPRRVSTLDTNRKRNAEIGGRVTLAEMEASGLVSRKTLMKHIRSKELIASKEKVMGVEMWLISPRNARAYLNRVDGLLEKAVREKRNRPKPVNVPDGFVAFADLADETGLSHWTVRKAIQDLDVPVEVGRHGKKLIPEARKKAVLNHLAGVRKPVKREAVAQPVAPKKGRLKGGLFIDSYQTLHHLLMVHPDITISDLVAATGCSNETARRWKASERITPPGHYQRALVAYFRERFSARLSPALVEMAEQHRREYMAAKMRDRRQTFEEV